ncbi:MAG: molybdopterin-dependent oxidoreductase [Candidatus Omnitrophica bacterium]|nr:molybdopterin-dependent oxidoreductase [Candidatus Omnitrophota bacterium]
MPEKIEQCDFGEYTSPLVMTRRTFLKIFGGGVFVMWALSDLRPALSAVTGPPTSELLSLDVNVLVRIGEDGRVTCLTGKIEMGQGVVTSLAQMLAEELDVPLDRVTMVMGDTRLCPYDRGTWGSLSTPVFGPQLRAAGAEARAILLQLASQQLEIPAEELDVQDGTVFARDDKKKRVTYAALTKGKLLRSRAKGKVHLKNPGDFKIINTPVTRRDAFDKVTGRAQYTADISLPGMLYATILRPPVHGAKRLDADVSEARKINGVQVIEDGRLIAVLHKYPDVAAQAVKKIKAHFGPSAIQVNDQTIFDHLLKESSPPQVADEAGTLSQGRKTSSRVFEQTYLDGYVAHAPMEPHAAVAEFKDGEMTIWASTQNPFGARDMVATALSVPAEKVRVITPFVGGGFGGKSRNLQVVEAARLAMLTGRPVQVAWSREEEFFYDHYRPAAIVKINSGLTENGKLSFWDFHTYYAGGRGSQHQYKVPHLRTSVYGAKGNTYPDAHPVLTGAWRAPGNNTNTFARESQIDIMAAAAGIDPLEFRLMHLTDQRMKKTLEAAANQFGWVIGKAPSGRGWGIAIGTDVGAYVAMIAEVEVDKGSGYTQVKRIVCAQDNGLTVNPAGLEIQMEGGITMGLGYALTEDVHFENGKMKDTNFGTYELPRFSSVPKIETVLVGDKFERALGGGEPAIIAVGGAVANAIYDACGARLFQLPMTPDRIQAAMPT